MSFRSGGGNGIDDRALLFNPRTARSALLLLEASRASATSGASDLDEDEDYAHAEKGLKLKADYGLGDSKDDGRIIRLLLFF